MATPSNSSSSAPSGAGSGGNNLHSSQGNDRSTSPHHQITDTLSTTSVIVKEGWLRKKGSRANLWSERYFVLRGPSLFYFIKSDNVEPKGVFLLQPACKVSEIRSDLFKKRKQFLFRISWPLDEETDDESSVRSGSTSSTSKKGSVTKKRAAHGKNSGMNPSTIAALAVGGVVVGALTAGVGLVAGMVVVGIGAAAGGGAAAISHGGKSDKEKFLTLACDSYHDAERWTDAIETQIRELGDSLYDFPMVRGGPNSGLTSRNAPPEKKLEAAEQWIRWSRWKLNTVLQGIRIFEQDKAPPLPTVDPNKSSESAADAGLKLLRVNIGMSAPTVDVFTTLMNMPPACLSGIIRDCRVIESMDNETDIIYMELEPVYMYPTYTAPRDLVLARYWKHNNDQSYVICLDSVEHREYPVRTGYVRAQLHGVYVLTPPKFSDPDDGSTGESMLSFIGQMDPRGWLWDWGGYRAKILQEFMLHVVDVRDAVCAERYTQVQFDPTAERANLSIASRALVGAANAASAETAAPSLANTPPFTLPQEMWGCPDASTFKIRGQTYLQDRVKASSAEPVFKLLGIDLLEVPDTTRNIASHPRNRVFQALQRGEDTWVFVVNIMVPGPPFLSFVVYLQGNKKQFEADTPFGRVAYPFFFGNDDEFRNNRFKLIPKVVDGNMVVKMAVKDTPTLLGNKLKQYYYRGDNYFELDVDVGSSSVARHTVGIALGYSKAIVVDMGFCLQGNEENELPEVLMGAVSCVHLDAAAAKKL